MIVSVQSTHFISLTTAVFLFFLSGSGSSVKISISIFQNSDFSQFRDYISILIRKINWSFSLLSYIPHIWLFSPLRMEKLAIVELNRVIKAEIRNIKLHLREKKSLKKELRDKIGNVKCKML